MHSTNAVLHQDCMPESFLLPQGHNFQSENKCIQFHNVAYELDRKIQRSTQCQSEAERHVVHYRYICELFATLPEGAESVISLKNAIVRRIGGRLGEVCRINMAEDTNKISIEFYSNEDMSYHVFQREMEEVLEDLGFQNLEIIKLDRRTMRR